PHIGHLYSAIIADTIHRYHRICGKSETIFSTGTDEYGIKCCQGFREAQTTDELHRRAVQTFWTTLWNNGFIHKSSYEGWYCVSDETFVTELQVITNADNVKVSAESGNPVEWSSEDNYIFKLSQFKDQILDWINSGDTVKPSVFATILSHEVEKGLRDISVSRPKSRLSWGIEVPNDCTQVIYVWFDALINYLTVSGYPSDENHVWPPDCQVIGKDILKFHGIYWPAFLMAAGLKPPRSLLCHSHWLKDDIKMSKSRGNVVDPIHCINQYTSDGFRYFLLRQGSLHTDSNFTELKAKQYLNAELADNFGNLLNRCTAKAINKNQIYPNLSLNDFKSIESESFELIERIQNLAKNCENHYLSGSFHLVINDIMDCLRLNNIFFNETKPWLLAKEETEEQKLLSVLYITLEALRVSAILLQPIVPNIANQVLNKLNISPSERNWINAEQTFPSQTIDSQQNKSLSSRKSIVFAKI
ncbi:unnamed protein product, partial [Oppiella nova]